MTDDRREYQRLPVSVEVKYRSSRQDEPETGAFKSKNVGPGGLCLVLLKQHPVGAKLDLSLTLPGEEAPVIAKGQVAWIEEFAIGAEPSYDTGIEFIDIQPEDVERINQCLKDRSMQ